MQADRFWLFAPKRCGVTHRSCYAALAARRTSSTPERPCRDRQAGSGGLGRPALRAQKAKLVRTSRKFLYSLRTLLPGAPLTDLAAATHVRQPVPSTRRTSPHVATLGQVPPWPEKTAVRLRICGRPGPRAVYCRSLGSYGYGYFWVRNGTSRESGDGTGPGAALRHRRSGVARRLCDPLGADCVHLRYS
jgi:hypothetical protein